MVTFDSKIEELRRVAEKQFEAPNPVKLKWATPEINISIEIKGTRGQQTSLIEVSIPNLEIINSILDFVSIKDILEELKKDFTRLNKNNIKEGKRNVFISSKGLFLMDMSGVGISLSGSKISEFLTKFIYSYLSRLHETTQASAEAKQLIHKILIRERQVFRQT